MSHIDTQYADAEAPLHIVTADPHTLALSIRASCLVFEDPASKALLDPVHRIAPSDATALIIGETGTGKELIARRIHELSEPAGLVHIRKATLARKTVPLVTTYAPGFCSRVSLAPQLIGPTVTASPSSDALRLHQLISVYRI